MRTEDGKEIIFIREDGSLSEGPVMQRGSDPTSGEVVFYELQGHLKPSVNGKDTYERVCIQRVFPAVRAEEDAREAA
jgi:hypothetical protein